MCQITKNDSTIAFWEFDAVLYQETILSSGVFRRATASGFYPFGDATDLAGEGGVGDVVCLIQARLEIRHATALTTGAKHWHR